MGEQEAKVCVVIPGRGILVCACNVIRSSLLTMQMSQLGALVFQEMIPLCMVAFCFLTVAGIMWSWHLHLVHVGGIL